MPQAPGIESDKSVRIRKIAVLALIALPILLNAIALFPEVTNTSPSDNDQIFHYLFIERADQALAAGDNPFDHWLPEVEAGFPQFFYYQNLPHLGVVALHHLLLERISLLTSLNLIRYLLMVLFPLTVYWSMREMEFSPIAAAVGAAFCSMLSSRTEYSFDYHSYIWLGTGMFPQLCSMHLMFIAAACLYRVLVRSRGYAAAIISSSAIVLSDLLYGYIFAFAAALMWLSSMWKALASTAGSTDRIGRVSRLTMRFAVVAMVALVITAYQAVPFFHQVEYINHENAGGLGHISIGLSGMLRYLLAGHLFDENRLPIVTILVFIGIVYGTMTRAENAIIALSLFGVFLVLTYGRATLAPIFALMPAAHLVPFQRMIAGVDFGAILLAGLGGELIWNWWPWEFFHTRAIAPLVLLLALFSLTIPGKWHYYALSQREMLTSQAALQDDFELAQVLAALKAAPPGRVYAGSRGNWGNWMQVGRPHLYDLLPIELFATVMPWQSLSLNTPYLWRLNIPSDALCRLFNIRYVIAPPTLRTPESYKRLLTTSRYILYDTGSDGYIQLGQISKILPMASSAVLYARNREWIASQEPSQGSFIAFVSHHQQLKDGLAVSSGSTVADDKTVSLGTIDDETVTPDSFSANVTATSSALLVVKTTYHPNWHVTVDGQEQPAFMVSPSFIGTMLTAGPHKVVIEYRSSRLKNLLLVLSCITLLATIGIGAFHLEEPLFGRLSD